MTEGLSILELARIHHEILLEVLRRRRPTEVPEVATAASEFFLEVLATFDMAQRGFLDDAAGSALRCSETVQGSPTEGSRDAASGNCGGGYAWVDGPGRPSGRACEEPVTAFP